MEESPIVRSQLPGEVVLSTEPVNFSLGVENSVLLWKLGRHKRIFVSNKAIVLYFKSKLLVLVTENCFPVFEALVQEVNWRKCKNLFRHNRSQAFVMLCGLHQTPPDYYAL